MSCENNSSVVSNSGGVNSGINRLQNKFCGMTGRLVSTATGLMGRSATKALFVIESFDGPKSLDAVTLPTAAVLEAGALFTSAYPLPSKKVKLNVEGDDIPEWLEKWAEERQGRIGYNDAPDRKYEAASPDRRQRGSQAERAKRPPVSPERFADTVRKRTMMALGLLKLLQTSSTFLGTGVARMSRLQKIGVVDGLEQRFFFLETTKVPVMVWKSRLTPFLNLLDSGLGAEVVRSDGLMFELDGKTWHRGTVVVKTVQGERTITHLQSLSTPPAHYYFSRRLDDNEAVGIVSGQKGFNVKSLIDRSGDPVTGYAGQISEVEALFPMWARVKKQLIHTHLRWGAIPKGKPFPESVARAAPAVSVQGSNSQHRGPGDRQKVKAGNKSLRTEPAPPPPPKIASEIHPLDGIGPRVRIGRKDCKVMVMKVTPGISGAPDLADAVYYDEEASVWKEIKDSSIRAKLAAQVAEGLIEPVEACELPKPKG